MATPNMPSSAQDIINNFLSGGYSIQAQANPFRVNVDPFRPPSLDTDYSNEASKSPTDPCPEGFIYDPVMRRCMPIEEESSDRPDEPDRDKMMFDQMKRDNSTIFGASNTLDDYLIDTNNDNLLLKFDPSIGSPPPIFGLGLLDTLLGGNKRREDRFNEAMQTYVDAGYAKNRNDGTFQIFTPQQYYNSVKNNPLENFRTNFTGGFLGENQDFNNNQSPITVGQAVDSVMNPTPQSGTSEGSPIAQDLSGGLLGTAPLTTVDSQGNRSRNDTAYRAAVARNIERNKRNFGTSGFKEGVGFTRGR
tara:strand:- start:3566 stop:4477 length:912 start_codon:yes stop_codon:yes gene_type:complete